MLPRSGAVSAEHSVGLKKGKRKKMQGGREMLRGGTQGRSEEGAEGERKMDSEADCECCLMMFIRLES